jgi:hypothetical protein
MPVRKNVPTNRNTEKGLLKEKQTKAKKTKIDED